jgi:hypothetical protein
VSDASAQDLGVPFATFLDVGATISDLLFDREHTTVDWRPSFLDDVLQGDDALVMDDDVEGH